MRSESFHAAPAAPPSARNSSGDSRIAGVPLTADKRRAVEDDPASGAAAGRSAAAPGDSSVRDGDFGAAADAARAARARSERNRRDAVRHERRRGARPDQDGFAGAARVDDDVAGAGQH